jgi:hypothetical protein
MEMPITVTLSNEWSERVKRAAKLQRQNVVEVIETALNYALPRAYDDFAQIDLAESSDLLTPEMQTFISMHPMLKENYFGQYVAIYNGKLIDHDTDHAALYSRIDAQYPDEFVWISPVEEKPIPTMVVLSPRIERNMPA